MIGPPLSRLPLKWRFNNRAALTQQLLRGLLNLYVMQVRNSITLIGNLGQDPRLVTLESGTSVVEFSLATNDRYRDREGNFQDRTEWHTVKAYGNRAETMAKYLTKGSKIAVSGALRYRKWEDKHGQKRTTAEIVCEDFAFLDPRGGGQTTNAEYEHANATSSQVNDIGGEPAEAQPPKQTKAKPSKKTKSAGKAQSRTTKPSSRPAAVPALDEDLPF